MSTTEPVVVTWTVIDLIKWSVGYFVKHNIDSPRLSAELLLCHVLQVERLKLYTDFERLLSTAELKSYRSLLERRVRHREPLQYILGSTNFYGCNFILDSSVLIPRPETELLVAKAIEHIQYKKCSHILDIGTGSGCIAIAIAKRCPQVEVTAFDISSDAIDLAVRNAQLNEVDNVRFLKLDVLSHVVLEQFDLNSFDLIVSNPPYISLTDYAALEPELLNHEPKIALTDGADGSKFYRRYAQIFPLLLKNGASFFLELGYNTSAVVCEVMRDFGIVLHKDYDSIDRIAEGHVI